MPVRTSVNKSLPPEGSQGVLFSMDGPAQGGRQGWGGIMSVDLALQQVVHT